MKLVDILARELKVWPEDLPHAMLTQSERGSVNYVINNRLKWAMPTSPELAEDWLTAIVTRAEWQAAVDALKVDLVEYSPAMHAQRVGRVTRVTENPALVDSREQFEQAFCQDSGGALPDGTVDPAALASLVELRMGDSYSKPGIARPWYWWKRARAGVVVDMTSVDFNNTGDILLALEAAGVKVAT